MKLAPILDVPSNYTPFMDLDGNSFILDRDMLVTQSHTEKFAPLRDSNPYSRATICGNGDIEYLFGVNVIDPLDKNIIHNMSVGGNIMYNFDADLENKYLIIHDCTIGPGDFCISGDFKRILVINSKISGNIKIISKSVPDVYIVNNSIDNGEIRVSDGKGGGDYTDDIFTHRSIEDTEDIANFIDYIRTGPEGVAEHEDRSSSMLGAGVVSLLVAAAAGVVSRNVQKSVEVEDATIHI